MEVNYWQLLIMYLCQNIIWFQMWGSATSLKTIQEKNKTMTHLIKQITGYLNDNEKWKWKLSAVALDFYINVMTCNVISYTSIHLFDLWRVYNWISRRNYWWQIRRSGWYGLIRIQWKDDSHRNEFWMHYKLSYI